MLMLSVDYGLALLLKVVPWYASPFTQPQHTQRECKLQRRLRKAVRSLYFSRCNYPQHKSYLHKSNETIAHIKTVNGQ